MTASAPDWGPWAPDIDAAERMARCRVLAALTHVLARPKGQAVEAALHLAATGDTAALAVAAQAFNALPTLPLRHVLAAYVAAEHSAISNTTNHRPSDWGRSQEIATC